jgi:SAM-dependent MidA family methyltransferase
MQVIAREIEAAGGAISFARFMELALHAPGLGYYSAGARKFGAAGDFVTAPELGSLFGRTLARQAAQCIRAGLPDILELGAGSGRLARDVLAELAALDCLPGRYLILETSAELKARQRELLQSELPRLAARVAWLDALPCAFEGLIVGNEVLDAMPVHLVTTRGGAVLEQHVQTRASGGFGWAERPAGAALRAAAARLALPDQGYTTEIALAAAGFIRTLSSHLARGAALFIDYGFPAREYYHPQRAAGTLMCHYRQRAHDDPLTLVGLQDITAHVDFSALARASVEAGLAVVGYATQAQFLINCGITDILGETPADAAAYMPLASTAQKLLSPAEMGELFKVVAVGKGLDFQLLGFSHGDRRDTL